MLKHVVGKKVPGRCPGKEQNNWPRVIVRYCHDIHHKILGSRCLNHYLPSREDLCICLVFDG